MLKFICPSLTGCSLLILSIRQSEAIQLCFFGFFFFQFCDIDALVIIQIWLLEKYERKKKTEHPFIFLDITLTCMEIWLFEGFFLDFWGGFGISKIFSVRSKIIFFINKLHRLHKKII
jgi:hypothetical protein